MEVIDELPAEVNPGRVLGISFRKDQGILHIGELIEAVATVHALLTEVSQTGLTPMEVERRLQPMIDNNDEEKKKADAWPMGVNFEKGRRGRTQEIAHRNELAVFIKLQSLKYCQP